jgi:hypothetical protein
MSESNVADVATQLELERVERARVLAAGERDREIVAAEKRARYEALVEARLDGYDEHFKIINGSIGRTADALEALKISLNAATAEKKAIVGLQTRQIAALATIATLLYVVLSLIGHA